MEVQHSSEILHDFSPRIRVYKDGTVERLLQDDTVSSSCDLHTGVHSKDVTISPNISARLYVPDNVSEDSKLPLLIYIHGGAYCLYSAKSTIYHSYLNSLVSEANVIAVSVDYRLAPEHPIPACYDDAWEAACWAASHTGRTGPDSWLNRWADFSRLSLAGDSAGANIAHDVIVRSGPDGLLAGDVRLALVHPFFGEEGENPLWEYLCPTTTKEMDWRLNPTIDPARLRREVGCARVMVCVGGKDFLKGRGIKYYNMLKEEGWKGEVEYMESKGRGHVFHLYKPQCAEAKELLMRVADFIGHKSSIQV